VASTAVTRDIDPLSDRPVYKQIADIIRDHIDDGDLGPGDRLPSETDLVQRFGTARATVRSALEVLAGEGRVTSARGIGVFVRERHTGSVVVRQTTDRFAREHREAGKSTLDVDGEASGVRLRQEVLALEETPAPPEVAERLQVPSDTTVFARRRLVYLDEDGTPMQLADSYIPLALANGRTREPDSGPGGTYARIEETLGRRLTRFTEELTFRMPTPSETHRLRLGPGIPVVNLIRVAYAGDRPVECFVGVMAGDKHRLEYRIGTDDE
jgi:GntR family transcriptional regulator